MAAPATSWTGSAVVNGVMAIILLVWLADIPTRGSVPPRPTKAATTDPTTEPPNRPIEKPASVDLPPPPPRPVSEDSTVDAPVATSAPAPASDEARPVVPLRPSTDREIERPVKIVALRAREVKPHATNPPVPTPLRPLTATKPAASPDLPNSGAKSKAKVEAEADTRAKAEAQATAKAEAEAEDEVAVSAKAVRNGRQLLRILEHGEGPAIVITWPRSSARRERLHGVLQRCFGMRLALIDQAGGLYLDDGPKGRKWPIDLDRFSGFVRRPNGHITSAERHDAGRVARYHHGLPATDPVRLFPRATDAALLGGLAHLLGDDYRAAKTITASYRLRGLRVTVGDLRIDGRRVAGRIDLSRGATAACRGAERS